METQTTTIEASLLPPTLIMGGRCHQRLSGGGFRKGPGICRHGGEVIIGDDAADGTREWKQRETCAMREEMKG